MRDASLTPDEEAEIKATAAHLTETVEILAVKIDNLNRHIFWMLVAGFLVFILAVAVGLLTYNTYSLVQCQSSIIQTNREQLDAQDELFTVVNDRRSSDEQRYQASLKYQRLIQEYKEHRDEQGRC